MRQLEALAQEAQSFTPPQAAMAEQVVTWHGRGAAPASSPVAAAPDALSGDAVSYTHLTLPTNREV